MAIKRSTGLVNKLNGIKTTMVLNGTFESALGAEWTSVGATLTTPANGVSGNSLTIASTPGVSGAAYQDITTVVGRIYRINVDFKKGTGVSGSIAVGTTGSPTSLYSSGALTDASWTNKTAAFIATATTTRITLRSDSTVDTETALFDNVVFEEVFDGFIEIMKNCKCNIYKGTRPATADDAASAGDILATITIDGGANGLVFTESITGSVGKPSGVNWRGAIAQNGTATYFRFYEAGDSPQNSSSVAARFDGSIGTSGTDMVVGSTNVLTAALNFDITGFSYTAPM